MIELSLEQIRAAQTNDLEAIKALLTALEPRIGQLANRYASNGGQRNADLAEELEQIGRIRAWRCIESFAGTTVAEFFAYVDRYVRGDMDAERRTETRRGVSIETAKRFERCLSVCGGDPYAAEREAVSPSGVLGRERMTPDTAHAARLAWQGLEYLDRPMTGYADVLTIGDLLADTMGVPVDLLEPSDFDRARRNAIREAVHATLARMGRQMAFVLQATYGVGNVPHMPTDAEIATALEVPETRITTIRHKAKARFRELYLTGAHTLAA